MRYRVLKSNRSGPRLHDRSVNMIETVSSWILPESSGYHREPARPVELRQANFNVQFEWHTVIYDCFRVEQNRVMLVAPPLDRFDGILSSLRIHALPTGNECRYRVHHKFTTAFANRRTDNLCRILVEVPEAETSLHLDTVAGANVLDIRQSGREAFRGRRVIFTLSQNNQPTWVCDWMRFHRDLHGADGVLLYDNASTAYTAEALLEKMKQVSGFSSVYVVSWPYKYGPQGVGRGTWDSSFSQYGALEDARWRYLADAYAVLNCDIDELALSSEDSIFDKATACTDGYVKFSGRWVTASNGEESGTIPRHQESTQQQLPQWRWEGFRPRDVKLCPAKWAVVPDRCPADAHWSIHEIVGMPTHKAKIDETSYRHFSRIGTNWKNNREAIERCDPRRQKEDERLQQAFARVRWNE
jgi:hypothetical protein